jgi:hypothetical protein
MRELGCARDVDREARLEPTAKPRLLTAARVVTARQHRDAGARGRGTRQHQVGESATRVRRDHEVVCVERLVAQVALAKRQPRCDTRPVGGERIVQLLAAGGQAAIDADAARARGIEDQHDPRGEPVPARDVHDAPTAKSPAHAARNFPRFVELFTRQAMRGADGARELVEQRRGGEARQVARRKQRATSQVEGHV